MGRHDLLDANPIDRIDTIKAPKNLPRRGRRRRQGCAQAGVEIDIHQLRHAPATELINTGVSMEAVRCRLGHASTETGGEEPADSRYR